MEVQPKDTSRGHFYVSLVKSGLRIVAGVFLIDGSLLVAGSLLILAECLVFFSTEYNFDAILKSGILNSGTVKEASQNNVLLFGCEAN